MSLSDGDFSASNRRGCSTFASRVDARALVDASPELLRAGRPVVLVDVVVERREGFAPL